MLTVRAQGTVLPRTETTLISQVAGEITATSRSFEVGGFFGRGEVLEPVALPAPPALAVLLIIMWSANSWVHRLKEADLARHLANPEENGNGKKKPKKKAADSEEDQGKDDYALSEALNLLKGLAILRPNNA